MYFRTVLILATVACLRADPVQLQSSTLQVAVSANMATLQLNTRPTLAVGYYAVVGGEFTLIRAFNGAQLTVSRAQAGTVGMAHAIGTVAWIAPSGATISADPVGACLRSTMPYAPVLSYATGSAWDCIGSVWTVVTPGFYDSGLPGYRNIRGTAAVRATTACDIGDKYFTTDSVAGQNLYGCTATNTWTLLSGGGSSAFSSLTSGTNTGAAMVIGSGASLGVTGTGTNTATALTVAATAAGRVIATAVVAPSTPSAGTGAIYVDSTSKNLAVKDDAGVVKHGIQDATCTGQFISAISAAGVSTCTTASTTLGNEVTRVNGTTITVSASDAQGFAVGTGPTSSTTLATFTIDTRVITAIADLGGSPKQTRITFGTAWPTTTLAIAEVLGIGSAAGTGCTGLNNLFTVQDRSDTTHADIIYDSTGCTYTASSATAGQNAAATGYVYFAGDDAATVQVQVPSGSGLILTSTGGPTTINQTLSPTYGGVPFGAVGITAGAFSGTAINARTAMRTSPVFAGNSGISVIQGITGTTVSTTADVMSKSGTNTITGSITADNASAIRPIKQVSADPGTCTVGEAILNTTSHVAKDCTQTNTLTARGGSSGTSVHHITGMAGGAVAGPGTGVSGVFYCGTGCTIDPNAVAGTIQYADSVSDLDGYLDVVLPSTFAGTVDLVIWFYNNASAGTNIDLSSATGCYAVGDTLNGAPSFNADTSVTVASGASGAAVKATFANIATTNCAAGELMKVRLRREGGDAFTGFVDVSAVDFSLTY